MQISKQKRVMGVLTLLALAVLPAFAQTNAVQMVTYFPVPYARYNNIYPQKKLDIGTQNGQAFELRTGTDKSQCTTPPESFKATAVNLRNNSGTPTLQMSQDFKTNEATFGDSTKTPTGDLTLNFVNLYLKDHKQTTFTSVKAQQLVTSSPSQIYMLKGTLPGGCSTGNVRWTQLTFNGESKYYLVCCDTDGSCSNTCYGFDKQKHTCAGTEGPDSSNLPMQDGNGHSMNASDINTYQRSGSWNNNNCQCSCPSGSLHIVNNAYADAGDYDFCMDKCWYEKREGYNTECTSSTWQGRSVGASWNNSSCSCSCPYPYDKSSGAHGNGCTYRCDTEYYNGTITACETGGDTAGTWYDSSCSCDCGLGYQLNSSTGHCENKCSSYNPYYNSKKDECLAKENTLWRSSTCTCECKSGYEETRNGCKKIQQTCDPRRDPVCEVEAEY